MKKKLWIIVLAAVLLAAVLIGIFWNSIIIWVAPKLVLSGAITQLVSALETRFQAGPGVILLDCIDPEGKYTARMDLDTTNEILGDVHYDMTVQSESFPRKVLAEGSVTYAGNTVDLSVYLDGDFAAVSSDSLLQGDFYGITYASFPQDIRSNALLTYVIGEDTIQKWEESVAGLQAGMSREYEIPDIADFDFSMALYGVLALKAQVSTDVKDSDQKCHVITFSATGDEISAALEQYLPEGSAQIGEMLKPITDDPESSVTVSFWLSEQTIIRVSGRIQTGEKEIGLALHSGMDAGKDDLTILYSAADSEKADSATVQISTDFDNSMYAERMEILTVQGETRDRTVLDYSWSRENGKLLLNLTQGGEDTSLQMNLTAAEGGGFCLITDQFETLMGILNDEKKTGSSVCTMVVKKGSEIVVPEYKNFNQWTLEDLLLLLGGVGSLFGIS